jgi:hypothetical protein
MTIDYEGVKNQLTTRIGQTMQRRPTGTDWDQKWIDSDRERLGQVGLLEQAVKGSNWTDQVNKQADSQQAAQEGALGEQHRQAQSSIQTDTAARGMLGSSVEATQVAANDARLAVAKTKAKQQADELKAAGLRDLGDLEQQLLDSILTDSASESSAQSSSLQAQQAGITGAQLQAKNAEMYRNSLANALGGFVKNGVTPTIDAGFKTADRQNQALYQQATLTNDLNKRQDLLNRQTTWYGYGNGGK